MKRNRMTLARLAALLILLTTASQGLAQSPASTPAELQQRIRIDQRVRILLADGRRITGNAQEVTDAQLRLRTSSGIENINIGALREVSVRHNDAIWNGLITGFAAGLLAGLVLDQLDDCEHCHDALYTSTALGVATGVGIDLLFRSTTVLYRPSPSTEPRLSFGFRSNRGIKVATVSFRF